MCVNTHLKAPDESLKCPTSSCVRTRAVCWISCPWLFFHLEPVFLQKVERRVSGRLLLELGRSPSSQWLMKKFPLTFHSGSVFLDRPVSDKHLWFFKAGCLCSWFLRTFFSPWLWTKSHSVSESEVFSRFMFNKQAVAFNKERFLDFILSFYQTIFNIFTYLHV